MPNVWHTLCAGNEILFDHFGGKDRKGRVVKVTPNSIHVIWTAPSSGTERVVVISTKIHEFDGRVYSQFQDKNIRVMSGQLAGLTPNERVASHLRVDVADL